MSRGFNKPVVESSSDYLSGALFVWDKLKKYRNFAVWLMNKGNGVSGIIALASKALSSFLVIIDAARGDAESMHLWYA